MKVDGEEEADTTPEGLFGCNPHDYLMDLLIPGMNLAESGPRSGPFISCITVCHRDFTGTGTSKPGARRDASYKALLYLRSQKVKFGNDISALEYLTERRDAHRREMLYGKPPPSERPSQKHAFTKLKAMEQDTQFKIVSIADEGSVTKFVASARFRGDLFSGTGASFEKTYVNAAESALRENGLWSTVDEKIKQSSSKAGTNVL